jgi:hypothetical protein
MHFENIIKLNYQMVTGPATNLLVGRILIKSNPIQLLELKVLNFKPILN